jgi:hypothetical protein
MQVAIPQTLGDSARSERKLKSVDLTGLVELLETCSTLENAYITPYREHYRSNASTVEERTQQSYRVKQMKIFLSVKISRPRKLQVEFGGTDWFNQSYLTCIAMEGMDVVIYNPYAQAAIRQQ